jgi:DNA-binding PadR family transcriptional regulator
MYSDNSLLPRETVRLAALGALTTGERRYGALASDVRHFISRLAGPSLELMGSSIELLRHEGLVEPTESGDDPVLRITDEGRAELRALLSTAVRPPFNDLNKVVLALKMRFLHLLDPASQRVQADLLIEACRTELARLVDLRGVHRDEPGHLIDWLDHDIVLVETRLAWLEDLRATL